MIICEDRLCKTFYLKTSKNFWGLISQFSNYRMMEYTCVETWKYLPNQSSLNQWRHWKKIALSFQISYQLMKAKRLKEITEKCVSQGVSHCLIGVDFSLFLLFLKRYFHNILGILNREYFKYESIPFPATCFKSTMDEWEPNDLQLNYIIHEKFKSNFHKSLDVHFPENVLVELDVTCNECGCLSKLAGLKKSSKM